MVWDMDLGLDIMTYGLVWKREKKGEGEGRRKKGCFMIMMELDSIERA